jgi:hypothetical protein
MKYENRPGYITKKELFNVDPKRVKRYMDKVIRFVNLKTGALCLDVGELNPRMEYMKEVLSNIIVEQWDTEDLNFDALSVIRKYDAIFAFDILEHIQNCLWTVREMKKALKDDGSIYINLPENPYWLWGVEHYFEFPKGHFEKWILNPLDLEIVRQKKIFFIANWKAFFIGFRPLYRAIKNKGGWRNLARNMFCWSFRIYEVKKK